MKYKKNIITEDKTNKSKFYKKKENVYVFYSKKFFNLANGFKFTTR